MADLQKLVDDLSALTVLEAAELSKMLEEKWGVSAAAPVAVAAAPEPAGQFLKFWRPDMQLGDVLANVAVLPLQLTGTPFRMVPPFWSVALEIEMYLLLYLVVARRLEFAAIAAVAGLSYHLACDIAGFSWGAHYFTAPSAMLPFAAGALIYFMRGRGLGTVSAPATAAAFVLWFLNMLAGGRDGGELFQTVKSIRELAEDFDKRSGALMADGRRTLSDISRAVNNLDRNPTRLLFGASSSSSPSSASASAPTPPPAAPRRAQ